MNSRKKHPVPQVEEEYLLQSLAAVISGKKLQRSLVSRIQNNFDWEYFLESARKNRISSLLYFYLKDQEESFSKNCFKQLNNDYNDTLAYNIYLWEKTKPILKSLEEKGIEILLLKGIALGSTIYPSLGIRPMSDVDILIKDKDTFTFDDILNSLGYVAIDMNPQDIELGKMDYLTSFCYGDKTYSFHVHRHLVNSTLPTFSYISKIDMDRIWQKARPIDTQGIKALILSPEHQIIYLCEHSLRITHSFSRLIYPTDIALTINFYRDEIDWDFLIKESFCFGLERMVYCGLIGTHRVLHTEVPSYVLSNLKPKKLTFGEKVFLSRLIENRSSSGLSYFVHLAMNRKPSEKIRFLFRTLFPPKNMMAQRHGIPPSKINVLHYLARLKEIIVSLIS